MHTEDGVEPGQEEVVAFLSQGDAYHLPGTSVERIDTHAAILFLVGGHAYKMKRAVRYSFLDFSTLEKRRAVLEAEQRLNARTAPDLYEGLLAVTCDADGELAIGGDGRAVEWVLTMRRFDQDALFDRLAESGGLSASMMGSLAAVIADFHRTAEVRSGGGHEAMSAVVEGNASDLSGLADDLSRSDDIARLIEATRVALAQQQDRLEERAEAGFVRRCHGDLHLGNIFLDGDRPVLFDCLEFDEKLASIDVFYDLAFLLMDLCHRGLRERSIQLFNAYLDETWDDDGSALLPLFLAVRATIRAKIEGFEIETASSAEDQAKHRLAAGQYLDLAMDLMTVRPPRLIAIGGLSGSGKSTIARLLAGRLGTRHWPVLLRSDVIRKRLHGVAAAEPLGADAYRPESSANLYQTLARRARVLLRAGRTVIVDATFLDPGERSAIEDLASTLDIPFHGLWLEAPRAVLAARITDRRDDASDATVDVLERQLERDQGKLTWTVIDAGNDAEDVATDVERELTD